MQLLSWENRIISCFHLITLKVQAFVTVCYEWIHAFNTEFWSLQSDPLWDSFFLFCVTLASVTTKMLLPRAENLKVAGGGKTPHSLTQQEPCCSSLNGSVLNIHCTALTWHHLTFILLFLCRSILVVTISKMLWKYKRLFYSGYIYHTQKSVVKPLLSQSYSDCCSSWLTCRLHCSHWFALSLSPCLFLS